MEIVHQCVRAIEVCHVAMVAIAATVIVEIAEMGIVEIAVTLDAIGVMEIVEHHAMVVIVVETTCGAVEELRMHPVEELDAAGKVLVLVPAVATGETPLGRNLANPGRNGGTIDDQPMRLRRKQLGPVAQMRTAGRTL